MAKLTGTDNSQSINFLGNGTSIKGDIITNGDFRIDGALVGSINSKGKVVIGPSGRVEGEIVCQNADISGHVQAKVVVNELLTLKASAVLNGDIFVNKLAIEPGARFTGSCNMGDAAKAPAATGNNEKIQQREKAVK